MFQFAAIPEYAEGDKVQLVGLYLLRGSDIVFNELPSMNVVMDYGIFTSEAYRNAFLRPGVSGIVQAKIPKDSPYLPDSYAVEFTGEELWYTIPAQNLRPANPKAGAFWASKKAQEKREIAAKEGAQIQSLKEFFNH